MSAHEPVDALYRDHHAWLLNWLQRRQPHGDQASDVAHDTFLQVLLRPQLFAGLRQPRAWLSSVAKGLLIDRFRRQKLPTCTHWRNCPKPRLPLPSGS